MEISRITLGTAQLASRYGIANTLADCSTPSSPRKLLHTALDAGFNSIDTAPSYGDSEIAIGRFITECRARDVMICTKLPSASRQGVLSNEIEAFVDENVRRSVERLGGEIDFYLLHDCNDLVKYGDKLVRALKKHQERGMIKAPGISIYDVDELSLFERYDVFSAVQFPANIFDHRFLSASIQGFILERGIFAFARSIYLQGLFFVSPETAHPQVALARDELSRLRVFSKSRNWDMGALAFAFINSFSHIASLVIGMESPEQIHRNADNLKRRLPTEIIDELLVKFSGIADTVYDPRKWGVR